jgi:hypothetical protein
MRLDLCKLRPGDVIFSREPAWLSRSISLLTLSAYSHAMIAVYPDIWFETSGAGSGFKLIENVNCFEVKTGKYAVLADLPYVKLDVLRLATPLLPSQILDSIHRHIALRYPSLIEFIPLFFLLRPFPALSRRLVSLLSGKSADVGSYCSQMISQMLRDLYGASVGGPDDHISPGTLRKRLLKSGTATKVSCFSAEPHDNWTKSDQLENIYRNLLAVTSRLRAYQCPHNRDSFWIALAATFKQQGINEDPKKYAIRAEDVRRILTTPAFFRLHEQVWLGKYT